MNAGDKAVVLADSIAFFRTHLAAQKDSEPLMGLLAAISACLCHFRIPKHYDESIGIEGVGSVFLSARVICGFVIAAMALPAFKGCRFEGVASQVIRDLKCTQQTLP
jgi:hypothetical protein